MKLLVITGTYTFPNHRNPMWGIFFANLLAKLRPLVDGIVAVVPAAINPRWLIGRSQAPGGDGLAFRQTYRDIPVYRPRFLSVHAFKHVWTQSRLSCAAAEPLVQRLHRQWRFDLVIGYGLGTSAHLAQYFARQFDLRSVCWAIGSDVNTAPRLSAANRHLFRHNVRQCDLILTESDALRRAIVEDCPPGRHVRTYYKGIDLSGLGALRPRAEARKDLALSADDLYLISAGGLVAQKGSAEFYAAFKQLAGEWPNLRAIWVGAGELEPMRQQARRDGLAQRLILTGGQPRHRLLDYFQAADVMAFASYAEGLPNVVMESLACGLPTVATDVGGTNEVLADGLTGYLVPARNVSALVEGIRKMLKDPLAARQMARRGQELIFRHFDGDKNVLVARDILEHMAAGKPATGPFRPCADVPPGLLPMDLCRADHPS